MGRTSRGWRRVGAFAVGGLSVAVSIGAALAAPVPVGPTWGALDSPYVTGVICPGEKQGSSVALVSWDLGDGLAPAYLMDAISTDGKTDTGRVPYSTLKDFRKSTMVGDRASLTASLLRLGGNSRDPAAVGQLAELIAEQNGTGLGQSCLHDKTGGMSLESASVLLGQAIDQAGPYSVTVSADQPLIKTGGTTDVRARVTSAKGSPVPGVPVAFTSRSKDVSLDLATATTDAQGIAAVPIQLDSAVEASVAVTARATLADSATLVTAKDALDAVVLAPPKQVEGVGVVRISTKADPVLSTGATENVLPANRPVTPRVWISGMNGHSGNVTINVYGPMGLPRGGLCTEISSSQWADAIKKDAGKLNGGASTVSVTGDGLYSAIPFTPSAPGCFTVLASITTSDASPNVTRKSDFATGSASISITDTTVAGTLDHKGVILPGSPVKLTVAVAKSHGWSATVNAALAGPIKAPVTGCSSANYASAKKVWSSTLPLTEPKATLETGTFTKLGCYKLDASITFDVGTGTSVTWPLTPPSDVTAALVVKPLLLEAFANTTNTVSPEPASESVFVTGSAGLPAKLTVEMWQAAYDDAGCAQVDWTKATKVSIGKPTATAGDGWYRADSGATASSGCYSMVPVLTLDANPAATTRKRVGERYSQVVVGPPPQKPFSLKPTATLGAGMLQSHAVVLSLGAMAIIVLGLAAFTLREAYTSRRDERPDGPGSPSTPLLPNAAGQTEFDTDSLLLLDAGEEEFAFATPSS